MTIGMFTDAAERFMLGARNGFTPTAEPISDTAVTPFGLSLRTIPTRHNVVPVRAAGTGLVMETDKVTEITTDGSGADIDSRFDVVSD